MRRLILAAVLSSMLWPSWARAQDTPRIVITEFELDEQRRFEDLVADELLFRRDYSLGSYETFLDEVLASDSDAAAVYNDPGLIVDLARYLEFDAIVHGRLDRRRRPTELTLSVYDGGTGRLSGEVSIVILRGTLDDAELDTALYDVEDWIDASERPGGRGGSSVASGGRRDSSEDQLEALGLTESTDTADDSGWLEVRGGLDIVQRNFTLTSAEAGIQYDSGFYPGVEAILDVYPVKAFSPGTLDGLGLRVRVARYFVDTTLVLDDPALALDVPTRHKELGFALLYRHSIGAAEIFGRLGYERLAFTLGDNPIYESSEYAGVAIAVGANYAIVPDLFKAGAEIELRPAPSLGDAETVAFGEGSSFGLVFALGVELTPLKGFSIQGGYRFQQYATTFDGNGDTDLEGELEATDRYHQLGLRLGYAY